MALRSVLLGCAGLGALLLLGGASGSAEESEQPAQVVLTLREAIERGVWRELGHRSDPLDVDGFLAAEGLSGQVVTGDPLIKPFLATSIVSSLRSAGTRAGKQSTVADRYATEVALEVREAFYGLVAARQLTVLLADGLQSLPEGADRNAVARSLDLACRLERVAREALRVWTGLPPGTMIEPSGDALIADLEPIPPLESYLRDARGRRREPLELRRQPARAGEGVAHAGRGLVSGSAFIGVQSVPPSTGSRDPAREGGRASEFADSFIGPVVGFRFGDDPGDAPDRVGATAASAPQRSPATDGGLEVVVEESRMAGRVENDVRRAYDELVRVRRRVETLARSTEVPRRPIVTASAETAKDVPDSRSPAQVIGLAWPRAELLQAVFAYHAAASRLDRAVGRGLDEIIQARPSAARTPQPR
jgi:hypothetical protein